MAQSPSRPRAIINNIESLLSQVGQTSYNTGHAHGKMISTGQFEALLKSIEELKQEVSLLGPLLQHPHTTGVAAAAPVLQPPKVAPTLASSSARTRAQIESDRVALRNERARLEVRRVTEDDPIDQQIIAERLKDIQIELSTLSKEWKRAKA